MKQQHIPNRIYLSEDQLPKQWYNLRADMKQKPAPMLHPGTHQPVTEAELAQMFSLPLAQQELDDTTPFIDIPQPVQDFYKIYRPSPLVRAYQLEKALGTPAKIYYKFEGNNTSGSHKLNSAAAQAYYAKAQGLTGLSTETGAGQWGTALSEACAFFDIGLDVYMVKTSYEQKPFRKAVIETFGSQITPSPSNNTAVGQRILEKHPGTGGSLGCAISEAIEKAQTTPGYRYALGSVLNQVLLHQSVIGLEAKTAMDSIGEYPDVVIGCSGGGSNLGGIIAPYMRDKLQGTHNPRIVAVEPASCPSLTRGTFAYDFCDTGKLTPLAQMYTLGSEFIPSPTHAGGLRYHGMSPIISKLYADGYMEAMAVKQTAVFEAAILFSKQETILPAPESAHAIYAAIQEALACKQTGEEKTILFCLSGTGYFDMTAYSSYMEGSMNDMPLTDAELAQGLSSLPNVAAQMPEKTAV